MQGASLSHRSMFTALGVLEKLSIVSLKEGQLNEQTNGLIAGIGYPCDQ